EIVWFELEDGFAALGCAFGDAYRCAVDVNGPTAAAGAADLDAELALEALGALGVDGVLDDDEHERNERDRGVVGQRLVATQSRLDVPRVDRVVDQLEAGVEARWQWAH